MRAAYLAAIERASTTPGGGPLFEPLPGARELLAAVDAHPRYLSALLTGNIEPAARLKMRLVGLDGYFRLPGAYGDDSHDRRDLPALAAARISRHLGRELRPAQFIVIGDTPNDIACARHFGARAVGVGTGRANSIETLTPHAPDALFPDLTDTAAVIHALDRM